LHNQRGKFAMIGHVFGKVIFAVLPEPGMKADAQQPSGSLIEVSKAGKYTFCFSCSALLEAPDMSALMLHDQKNVGNSGKLAEPDRVLELEFLLVDCMQHNGLCNLWNHARHPMMNGLQVLRLFEADQILNQIGELFQS